MKAEAKCSEKKNGSEEKLCAISQEAISQIQKLFGPNSVQWLDKDVVTIVPGISTGSIADLLSLEIPHFFTKRHHVVVLVPR